MEDEAELRLDASVRVWGNFTEYPGKLPKGLLGPSWESQERPSSVCSYNCI